MICEELVMRFDTLIKGGMVIDGTRMPRLRADVDIRDGRIAGIGRLASADAARVLDDARRGDPVARSPHRGCPHLSMRCHARRAAP